VEERVYFRKGFAVTLMWVALLTVVADNLLSVESIRSGPARLPTLRSNWAG